MSAPPIDRAPLRVLLVEDDEGDALLFGELLAEVGEPVELTRSRSMAEAEDVEHEQIDCVVLDLALPDSDGLDGLTRLRERGAGAIVVLTGYADRAQGLTAVAAGAQDYLVKGAIDGASLERAMRYAVYRHRADQVGRELGEAKLLAAENMRLSRGLLPAPLLPKGDIGYAARYLPGGARLLLGGDFYDVVQAEDGAVWLIVGDVCGHGPDEAALGVALRIAWRTLVLGEHPADAILPTLHEMLVAERHRPYLFATAVMICVSADRQSATMWTAGHPPPLVRTGDEPWREFAAPQQLPLGVQAGHRWTAHEMPLGPQWDLMVYTDGLIEGRAAPGAELLWVDGLLGLLNGMRVPATDPAQLLDSVIGQVAALVPDQDDDIAVVMLQHPGTTSVEM
jgi:serine phosphatase RsbU (regulator of sigma subunit)